jgi:hypothetical protein
MMRIDGVKGNSKNLHFVNKRSKKIDHAEAWNWTPPQSHARCGGAKVFGALFKKEQLLSLTPRITPRTEPRKAEQRNEETTQ